MKYSIDYDGKIITETLEIDGVIAKKIWEQKGKRFYTKSDDFCNQMLEHFKKTILDDIYEVFDIGYWSNIINDFGFFIYKYQVK